MTLAAALPPAPPPRNGSTPARTKAGRIGPRTGAPHALASPVIELARKPWRWNPDKHEHMHPSHGA
jgi:hypothetical protein